MKTSLQSLQESISNAVDMIDQSQLISDGILNQKSMRESSNRLDFTNATSLLDKCERVTSSYQNTKPLIRVIHHFACSGGTLISKFLSSLPNVFLLSEVHPYSRLHIDTSKPRYSPTDMISQCRYGNFPAVNDLIEELFTWDVNIINRHVEQQGGILVIRDHTHVDYCVGTTVAESSVLAESLSEYFNLIRLATTRNPVDSYLSLQNNKWEHYEPKGFDEYCRRFLKFIEHYNEEEIFKYEDIVRSPKEKLEDIAKHLDIPFSETFLDTYDVHSVTGNSGRKSSNVELRQRREFSDEFTKEINNSENFRRITEKLGYEFN